MSALLGQVGETAKSVFRARRLGEGHREALGGFLFQAGIQQGMAPRYPRIDVFHVALHGAIERRLGPQANLLAGSDDEGSTRIWDVRDLRRVATVAAGAASNRQLVFSPDGRRLVILQEKFYVLVDAETGIAVWSTHVAATMARTRDA